MEQPPPIQPAETVVAQLPSSSLGGRLLNVFAVPSEVFEEIKLSPVRTANWLVPVLLFVAVSVAAVWIMFSQPAIQQQLREQQAKMFDKQVQAGKMTREQADQAIAIAEKFTGPTMLKLFGSAGAAVTGFVHLFWWGLVLWLLGRWFLHGQFPFLKSVEVAGLAMMISILTGIIGLLLTVNLQRLYATPSLALLLSDFDPTRRSHLFVGAFTNPFHFWLVALMGIGLAKLTGVSSWKAAGVVFAYFALQQGLLVLAGLGQMAL